MQSACTQAITLFNYVVNSYQYHTFTALTDGVFEHAWENWWEWGSLHSCKGNHRSIFVSRYFGFGLADEYKRNPTWNSVTNVRWTKFDSTIVASCSNRCNSLSHEVTEWGRQQLCFYLISTPCLGTITHSGVICRMNMIDCIGGYLLVDVINTRFNTLPDVYGKLFQCSEQAIGQNFSRTSVLSLELWPWNSHGVWDICYTASYTELHFCCEHSYRWFWIGITGLIPLFATYVLQSK